MTLAKGETQISWARLGRCPKCQQMPGAPCKAVGRSQFYNVGDIMKERHRARLVKVHLYGGVPWQEKREWRCLNPRPGVKRQLCLLGRSHKSNHRNGDVVWPR